MKHILHLITNALDPTLQATIQSQSERTDLRLTIVTTKSLMDPFTSPDTRVFSLSDGSNGEFDSSTLTRPLPVIGYAGLMDLMFDADSIITW